MSDELARLRYQLIVELVKHQGDEIDALQKANESLRKSHVIIGKMLEQTAKLVGVN